MSLCCKKSVSRDVLLLRYLDLQCRFFVWCLVATDTSDTLAPLLLRQGDVVVRGVSPGATSRSRWNEVQVVTQPLS